MLTHINGICLHISAKSCNFAVENKRDNNPMKNKIKHLIKWSIEVARDVWLLLTDRLH